MLNPSRIRQALTLVFVFGALLCVFPPDLPALRWWASRAEQVALAYLSLGLIFLVFKNERLMFVCFGCSAFISFCLSESARQKAPIETPAQKTESTLNRLQQNRPPEPAENPLSIQTSTPSNEPEKAPR